MISGKWQALKVEHRADGVVRIAINRPAQKNSQDQTLCREMNQILRGIEEDTSAKAVILTGTGDVFCGGLDLEMVKQHQGEPHDQWMPRGEGPMDWWDKWRTLRRPTVAVVNGVAFSYGLMPVLHADVTLASPKASFGVLDVLMGFPPGHGLARAILEYIPLKHLKWMLLTGQPITAQEAASIGLVNQVVPASRLEKEADRAAALLQALPQNVFPWVKKEILLAIDIPDHRLGTFLESAVLGRMRQHTAQRGGIMALERFVRRAQEGKDLYAPLEVYKAAAGGRAG